MEGHRRAIMRQLTWRQPEGASRPSRPGAVERIASAEA
jgi:hypothetical protein